MGSTRDERYSLSFINAVDTIKPERYEARHGEFSDREIKRIRSRLKHEGLFQILSDESYAGRRVTVIYSVADPGREMDVKRVFLRQNQAEESFVRLPFGKNSTMYYPSSVKCSDILEGRFRHDSGEKADPAKLERLLEFNIIGSS